MTAAAERIARAEHELRGAATALALACDAVRRDPRARRHAVVIEAQLDRLRAGLADLEAAREGRTAGTEVEDVEVPALVRAAVAPWVHSPAGRSAAFAWDGEPGVARLDRRRLMKALGNVVANAAEHGDGDIQVTGERQADRIRVQIRNRGRGLRIAAAAAEELGGRLSFEIDGEDAVATLELPAA